MGRDSHFSCKDCQQDYYLGYGSYLTWMDDKESLDDFDASDSPYKEYLNNQCMRQCLTHHGDHDFLTWSSDWCSIDEAGNLTIEKGWGRQEILIQDFKDFEYLDLEEEQASHDTHPL